MFITSPNTKPRIINCATKPIVQIVLWAFFYAYVLASLIFVADSFIGVLDTSLTEFAQVIAQCIYLQVACVALPLATLMKSDMIFNYLFFVILEVIGLVLILLNIADLLSRTWVLYFYFFFSSYLLIAVFNGYIGMNGLKPRGWED